MKAIATSPAGTYGTSTWYRRVEPSSTFLTLCNCASPHTQTAPHTLGRAHLVQACLRLVEYSSNVGPAKVVLWAHNSHCGDARATERGEHEEWNLGHMARATFGERNVFIVGFGTASGTVSYEGLEPFKRHTHTHTHTHALLTE